MVWLNRLKNLLIGLLLAGWAITVLVYQARLEPLVTGYAELQEKSAESSERLSDIAQGLLEQRNLLLERLTETREELKKELAGTTESLESLRNSLQASEATAETLRRQLAASDQRLQEQEQELRTGKETIDDLRKRLGEP